MNKPNFAFWGTPDRAVWALETLARHNLIPSVIITQPDRPQGRKMVTTPPPVKLWGEAHHVPVLQPEKLDQEISSELSKYSLDFSLVLAYGKILPKKILDIPAHGTFNIHGSFLPKYRGPSPIETAILNDDRNVGATIILMDEKMDHGATVAVAPVTVADWPPFADDLARIVVEAGAETFVSLIPNILSGVIHPTPQDESQATYTKKIKKENGLIDIADDPYKNYLKFKAYFGWPGTYFFTEHGGKKARLIIRQASFTNGEFIIERVIPEGKNEMTFEAFKRT